jgi:hypothetical protein
MEMLNETVYKRDDITGSGTPANLLAQMGYPHRGIVMKEEMGAVMPMSGLTDEVTDRIPPRRKFPPELSFPANKRLNLDATDSSRGRVCGTGGLRGQTKEERTTIAASSTRA